MSGWVKLFGSITESTIWTADYATRIVWVTMLAKADADGVVDGSLPGFARAANVTVEEMRAAIATLSAPDPDSRTPAHEGRRIETVSGGWRILNYRAYRDRGQGKDGSRAPYYRAYRQQKNHIAQHSNVACNTEADAEEEADTGVPNEPRESVEPRCDSTPSVALEFPTVGKGPSTWVLTTLLVTEWQACYPGLDVLGECRRALAWVRANPHREKTARGMPRFLVHWFNRATDGAGPTSRSANQATRHLTRPERERAIQMRRSWGRCRHEPTCPTFAACVGAIVEGWRADESPC